MNITQICNNKKKKSAYLLSTEYYEIENDKPSSLCQYKLRKAEVDVLNRMISNFRNNHKLHKWWKSIFLEILDISLINNYTISKYYNDKITHEDFRLIIAETLANQCQRQKRGRSSLV